MKGKEEWKVYGNVFSKHSLELLFNFSTQGYFDEIESAISVGKEANIFTAVTKRDERIIVKMYRLENCNFNKMYEYLRSDPRYAKIKRSKRLTVFTWTQREFRNLMIAREAIKVPKPIAFKDNLILMEFIGDEDPAPELKNHAPKEPRKFFEKIINNMKKLFRQGLIHADLSPFNILNYNEEPVFIDFSQSVPKEADNAKEMMRRDIKNVCTYFRKYFELTQEDEEKIYQDIIKPGK